MKEQLQILFYSGRIGDLDDPEEAISLLREAALHKPEMLFEVLASHINSPMVIVGLAAFICNGSDDYINNKIKNELFKILIDYEITELKFLTELIKSKIFGRGLGSRSQKLLRRVMENWTVADLKNQIVSNHQAVRDLIQLIHPRFSDSTRSDLVRDLFNKSCQ